MSDEQKTMQFWSACLKKSRYPTEARAKKYAKTRTQAEGRPINYYPCKYCGGFHLTHKPVNATVTPRRRHEKRT